MDYLFGESYGVLDIKGEVWFFVRIVSPRSDFVRGLVVSADMANGRVVPEGCLGGALGAMQREGGCAALPSPPLRQDLRTAYKFALLSQGNGQEIVHEICTLCRSPNRHV